MEELITIDLFGQPFTFKADSEVNQARAVAEVLMSEVQRIQRQHGDRAVAHHSKLTILMSAALNIANENLELKQLQQRAVEKISSRSERLLNLLDKIGQ